MLGVPHLLRGWIAADRMAEFAERIAGRSRLAVWQRVVDRLPALEPTECRGYLRARAVAVIREETARLVEQEGTRAIQVRTQIETAALDLLIRTIIDQLDQRQRERSGRRAA